MTAEPVGYVGSPANKRWRWPSRSRVLFLAGERLRTWGLAELAHLSLWTPVAIGAGAGFYFSLKSEPHWLAGFTALLAASAAVILFARIRPFVLPLLFAALGFVAADVRTAVVEAPQLWRELGVVETTGRLISIEESHDRRRYVVALQSLEGAKEDELPARARITWRGKGFDAVPGDLISVRASLSPPPPPVAPGAFDYARQLYFQRIGAVGFAVTAPVIRERTEGTLMQRLSAGVESMRVGLFKRITSAAPGEGGAILAAIVTGKREAISESAENALRDAGLAHLLAISGLHMGIATGLIFFVVRFCLAAIEPVALRYPIKKWAAAVALVSGLFYLIMSGGGWSARRAFLMAGIMFVAILVDRRALSLRNVAVAAVLILLTTPEALFHPGFQMSFAAVTALIAAYEWYGAAASPDRRHSWDAKAKRYAVGLAATDTIAALATAPYALYHFHRVALYSLPANVAAMPLMGFWIAPFAILALILAPFGLDGWAWRIGAAGLDAVLWIAAHVSSWPGAISVTAQWPLAAMLALTLGGLWLCLSRAPWRIAGLAAIPIAAFTVSQKQHPDLFVSATGLNAGIVLPGAKEREDGLAVFYPRREKFAAEIWKEIVGFVPEDAPTIPMRDVYHCDATGCVAEVGGDVNTIIAFTPDRATLAEDCARAGLVVAFFPVRAEDWRSCKAYLIDRRSAWRRGAHSVRIDENGALIVVNATDFRGRRPWTGD